MLRTCLLTAIILLALTSCAPTSPTQPTEKQAVEVTQAKTCDQLVTTALDAVGDVCSALSRNQACYGNRLVQAELQPNVQAEFGSVGDIVDLLSLKTISTTSIDESAQTWGVVLVKAQANLPDALPGQNVTFLLYGGAAIENVSPDMRAVVVKTGVTGVSCADAPTAAVVIQSPDGTQASMNINGADVTMGSTIYVTADENDDMDIATIEGSAVVESAGVTQVIEPGAQVSIPLDANLQVAGPPSEPEPFDVNLVQNAPITVLEREITIPSPIPPRSTLTPTSELPPVTDTLPPVTLDLPPTATATPCVPRADWTETYTIAEGDTLFGIAQSFNLSVAELQAGSCIGDADQIFSGQVLRVPFALEASTPTGAATLTVPPGTAAATNANFRADATTIRSGECTTLRWEAQEGDTVFLEGQPARVSGEREVCPQRTTRYTLLVVQADGENVPYFVSITVG